MIRKFFFFFFVLIALVFEAYFSLAGFAVFVFEVALFSLILAVFLRVFDRYKSLPFRAFFTRIFLSFCAFFGGIIALLSSFVLWHNIFPGELADITLSSATHSGNIVFLQMSHIATPAFYAQKTQKIQSLSASGYVFLVEGVRAGTVESQKKFNEHMGMDFTPTLYDTIADIIGLTAQDNKSLFAGVPQNRLRFIDVSIDDIARLLPHTPVLSASGTSNTGVVDMEKAIEQYSAQANSREMLLMRFVARALLNASLKSSEDVLTLLEGGEKAALMQVLLDERNKRILDYIAAHPDENIVIVYGALHFNGVFEALQQGSSSWKIDSLQTQFPYKN